MTAPLHFSAAPHDASIREHDGGCLIDEGEHITLVELDIDEALALIERGEIADGKTIMLLLLLLLLLLQRAVLRGPFAGR